MLPLRPITGHHKDLLFSDYLCKPWLMSMNSPFLLVGTTCLVPQVSSVPLPSMPEQHVLLLPQDEIMLTLVGEMVSLIQGGR